MHYSDFLDDDDLAPYVRAMNARANALNKRGRITVEHLRDCIYSSGGSCGWCGTSLVGQAFEVDHIIPLSNGGGNTPDNLAVACPRCNRRKSAQHPGQFAQTTYARTQQMTPLIQRVLDYYALEPLIQQTLFDDAPPDTTTLQEDAPDAPRAPYIWQNSEDDI